MKLKIIFRNYMVWASSDVVNCLAILAKALNLFFSNTNCFSHNFLTCIKKTKTYVFCFSTKILVAKLAQMGNFCLAKSDAM